MDNEPLIFVHSSFRTGSTWFQSRFRMSPEFCTYTEVYNEALATLKLEELGRTNFCAWNSKHPPSVPYFLEYAPLIKPEGGVEGFRAEFTYDRFFPEDPENLPADERAYIANLIANARQSGKIPVITCTRSLGRVAALKKAFGGLHLFIHRNIFNQWCSYTEQAATGIGYFLESIDRTLGPANVRVLQILKHTYKTETADANSANLFLKFVLLHCYLYQQALRAADHSIYLEDLSDNSVRQRLVDLIHQQTGCRVDFSGYDERRQFSFIDIEPSLLREAIATFTNFNDDGLDDASAKIVRRIHDACIESYADYRHQFSPLLKAQKAIHATSVSRLSELQWCKAELESCKAELEKALQERDRSEARLRKVENSFIGRIDTRIRRLGRH
jgi:hypothetical protein